MRSPRFLVGSVVVACLDMPNDGCVRAREGEGGKEGRVDVGAQGGVVVAPTEERFGWHRKSLEAWKPFLGTASPTAFLGMPFTKAL